MDERMAPRPALWLSLGLLALLAMPPAAASPIQTEAVTLGPSAFSGPGVGLGHAAVSGSMHYVLHHHANGYWEVVRFDASSHQVTALGIVADQPDVGPMVLIGGSLYIF